MNERKQAAVASVDAGAALYKRLSDDLWEHPELSLKETFAAERYCSALRELGFTVTENLGGIQTAFCGSFGHGKPVLGFLGEFDALSGLSQAAGVTEPRPLQAGAPGHGCGHNLLGVASLAAAVAVKDYLQATGREGTVVFYGCPGEEGGSGKAFLARDGAWKALDAALTWHPADVNEVRTGTNNSSIQVLYKFHGVAAHAASAPEQGRSALDAVSLMNVGAQFLREHVTPDCRVHYSVLDTGGASPNVVQAEASVLYMIRANKVRDTVALTKRVDKIAEGAALMTETELERVFIDGTAEIVPNFTLESVLYRNFEEVGVPTYTDEEKAFAAALQKTFPAPTEAPGIGARFDAEIAADVREQTNGMTEPLNGFLMPLYHGTGFVPGSSDVGDVSWQTPAAQIETVTWPAGAQGHTWQTVACGKSSIAEKGMLTAAKVLACSAIDLFEDSALLAEARAEFQKRAAEGYVCPIEDGASPIAL